MVAALRPIEGGRERRGAGQGVAHTGERPGGGQGHPQGIAVQVSERAVERPTCECVILGVLV